MLFAKNEIDFKINNELKFQKLILTVFHLDPLDNLNNLFIFAF